MKSDCATCIPLPVKFVIPIFFFAKPTYSITARRVFAYQGTLTKQLTDSQFARPLQTARFPLNKRLIFGRQFRVESPPHFSNQQPCAPESDGSHAVRQHSKEVQAGFRNLPAPNAGTRVRSGALLTASPAAGKSDRQSRSTHKRRYHRNYPVDALRRAGQWPDRQRHFPYQWPTNRPGVG